MSSTFTTNLRLNKQGDGDNPNSWGQVLNDGVISLVDDAVAGYTTITVGTTANVTLTENQGSGDQARSAFLEIQGSVGGTHSAINILIPSNSKSYVVRNVVSYASAGADVILKVAGQTGVTISPATNQHVITDGTSVFNVAQSEFSSLTVAGTVSVSGAATFKSAVSTAGTASFGSTVSVSGNATFLSDVTVKGNVFVSSKVCASSYFGDGSNLTGIVAMPTGAVIPFAGTVAPTGFLFCFGQTLNKSDYPALESVIGTTYGGSAGSTFALPDLRGRVVAGKDDMGGSSQQRLTGLTGGVDGDTLGASGGEQSVSLTEAQLPAHSHGAAKPFLSGDDQTRNSLVATQTSRDATFQGYETSTGGGDSLIQNTGSGSAHNNVQPTLILTYIIKT
jgi:microcystin-dependent protein